MLSFQFTDQKTKFKIGNHTQDVL